MAVNIPSILRAIFSAPTRPYSHYPSLRMTDGRKATSGSAYTGHYGFRSSRLRLMSLRRLSRLVCQPQRLPDGDVPRQTSLYGNANICSRSSCRTRASRCADDDNLKMRYAFAILHIRSSTAFGRIFFDTTLLYTSTRNVLLNIQGFTFLAVALLQAQ